MSMYNGFAYDITMLKLEVDSLKEMIKKQQFEIDQLKSKLENFDIQSEILIKRVRE